MRTIIASPGREKTPEVRDRVAITLSLHDSAPLAERRLLLTREAPRIRIGRASRTAEKGLLEARGNALFGNAVISRNHAELSAEFEPLTSPKIYVEDMDSFHGTYLTRNDGRGREERLEPKQPARLQSGDVLRLGMNLFRSDKAYPSCVMDFFVEEPELRSVPPRVFTVPDDEDEEDGEDEEVMDFIYKTTTNCSENSTISGLSIPGGRGSGQLPIDLTGDTEDQAFDVPKHAATTESQKKADTSVVDLTSEPESGLEPEHKFKPLPLRTCNLGLAGPHTPKNSSSSEAPTGTHNLELLFSSSSERNHETSAYDTNEELEATDMSDLDDDESRSIITNDTPLLEETVGEDQDSDTSDESEEGRYGYPSEEELSDLDGDDFPDDYSDYEDSVVDALYNLVGGSRPRSPEEIIEDLNATPAGNSLDSVESAEPAGSVEHWSVMAVGDCAEQPANNQPTLNMPREISSLALPAYDPRKKFPRFDLDPEFLRLRTQALGPAPQGSAVPLDGMPPFTNQPNPARAEILGQISGKYEYFEARERNRAINNRHTSPYISSLRRALINYRGQHDDQDPGGPSSSSDTVTIKQKTTLNETSDRLADSPLSVPGDGGIKLADSEPYSALAESGHRFINCPGKDESELWPETGPGPLSSDLDMTSAYKFQQSKRAASATIPRLQIQYLLAHEPEETGTARNSDLQLPTKMATETTTETATETATEMVTETATETTKETTTETATEMVTETTKETAQDPPPPQCSGATKRSFEEAFADGCEPVSVGEENYDLVSFSPQASEMLGQHQVDDGASEMEDVEKAETKGFENATEEEEVGRPSVTTMHDEAPRPLKRMRLASQVAACVALGSAVTFSFLVNTAPAF
ncbi:hypothetical protein GGS20DRAFT_591701 [Poronia punctata]|nr:hypothetical protein GGS20DRAFT_591701 [Poronia punctata]